MISYLAVRRSSINIGLNHKIIRLGLCTLAIASRTGVLGEAVALFLRPPESEPCDPVRKGHFAALAPGRLGWVAPREVPVPSLARHSSALAPVGPLPTRGKRTRRRT